MTEKHMLRWWERVIVRCLRMLPIHCLMMAIAGRTDMHILVALNDEVIGEEKGGKLDGAQAHSMSGNCHWGGTTNQIISALNQVGMEVMSIAAQEDSPNTVDEITGETWR